VSDRVKPSFVIFDTPGTLMLATVGDKGLKVPSVANDDRLLRTKLKTVVSELRSGGWSAS